jgi:hypothetical protein
MILREMLIVENNSNNFPPSTQNVFIGVDAALVDTTHFSRSSEPALFRRFFCGVKLRF